jgi:hypothetical protein
MGLDNRKAGVEYESDRREDLQLRNIYLNTRAAETFNRHWHSQLMDLSSVPYTVVVGLNVAWR